MGPLPVRWRLTHNSLVPVGGHSTVTGGRSQSRRARGGPPPFAHGWSRRLGEDAGLKQAQAVRTQKTNRQGSSESDGPCRADVGTSPRVWDESVVPRIARTALLGWTTPPRLAQSIVARLRDHTSAAEASCAKRVLAESRSRVSTNLSERRRERARWRHSGRTPSTAASGALASRTAS